MKHLILIKNDLFNIAKRINKINKKLFVFYNKKTKNFEIYSKNGLNFTFEMSADKILNQTLIKRVRENQICNISQIVSDIDKANLKLETQAGEKQKTLANDMLKDCLDFANKKNDDVDFSKLKIGGRNDS